MKHSILFLWLIAHEYGYRGASACSVLILGRESSKQEAVNSAVTVTL